MSKINFQQTSLFAYEEVKPKINNRHEQIMACFEKYQGISLNNRMISDLTGLPINCVTPRCLELRKKNMIQKEKEAKDQKTGRLTIFWKIA